MKAKIISIANQKGGAGKTTITALTATALHQYTDFKIAVVDADFQNSFSDLRNLELSTTDLKTLEKPPYPIFSATGTSPDEILKTARTYILDNKDKFDYIFVDVPGSINYNGIASLIAEINFFFIPVYPDFFTLKSTIGYIQGLEKIKAHPKANIKGYYCFFNKYHDNINKTEFKNVEEYLQESEIPLMESKVYKRVDYEREYRSTINAYPNNPNLPPNKAKKYIYSFIQELISLT